RPTRGHGSVTRTRARPKMTPTSYPIDGGRMAATHWIGVDLGGTKILAGLFDDRFQVVARAKQSTNYEEGGPAVFGRVVTAVDEVLKEGKVEPGQVGGMTLAVPWQIVPRSTIVRYAPNLDWRDFD